MGFFDKLNALLDDQKSLSPDELKRYFRDEIKRVIGPEHYNFVGKELTTNIGKIIWKNVLNEFYAEGNCDKSSIDIVNGDGSGVLTKVNDTIYRIVYLGKIDVNNIYSERLGRLYFRVVIHTDKFAKLSGNSAYESTVNVAQKPIDP